MTGISGKDSRSHVRLALGRELRVQDVMTKGVLTVDKYESIVRVAHILAERNISGLPVVDKEDKLIGILSQADILSMVGVSREHTFKDLLRYMLGERLPERKMGDIVGDIMTAATITIRPDRNIAEAVRLMDEKKIRRLPVVDGENRLVGILTRADILKAVIRDLQ